MSDTRTKTVLQRAGLVRKAPRRGAHRRRRPRKPCIGMMLHQDGSRHRWLDGQPPLNRPCPVEGVLPAHKPDGGLKDMMARVTMLAMHKDGLITLPPPRRGRGRPKPIVFGPDTEPPLFPAPSTLDDVRPLDLRTVVRGTREGKLWNACVARYHYLGYKTLIGTQMRYAVHDRNGWPIAMLGFSTAAWKLAPRDRFI